MKPTRQKLHPEGPEISKLVAGLWRMDSWGFSRSEIIQWIERCIELGITTFDHADIYGGYTVEGMFGEAIREKPALLDKIELVTKCNICFPVENRPNYRIKHYNTSPTHIRQSVENSLRNLHAEKIDLLLIHRPDPLMDATAVADSFMQLIEEGKIGHVGVSNFTPSQVELLQSRLDVPIVTNQVECSLGHTEPLFDGTFDQAQKLHASPMLWSPLAGGSLFKGGGKQVNRILGVLHSMAEKYGAAADQIALAWLMRLPSNPIPIIGTSRTDRMAGAVGALNIELDRQDWFTLLEASTGVPVP